MTMSRCPHGPEHWLCLDCAIAALDRILTTHAPAAETPLYAALRDQRAAFAEMRPCAHPHRVRSPSGEYECPDCDTVFATVPACRHPALSPKRGEEAWECPDCGVVMEFRP